MNESDFSELIEINDKSGRKYAELEERLIQFAIAILNLAENLPKTRAGNYISGQITRSGTAPALLYGEVQSAESRKDFIHKVQMLLKELRETQIALKIIERKPLSTREEVISLLKESDELIAIFVKSTNTARSNMKEVKYK